MAAGFKNAEHLLAELYSEMCKLSARVGFPDDPSKSVGSVCGDVGDLLDFAEGVEGGTV